MRALVAVLRTTHLPTDILLVIESFIGVFHHLRKRIEKYGQNEAHCFRWGMDHQRHNFTLPGKNVATLFGLSGATTGPIWSISKCTDDEGKLYYHAVCNMGTNADGKTMRHSTTVYIPSTEDEYLGERIVSNFRKFDNSVNAYSIYTEEFRELNALTA